MREVMGRVWASRVEDDGLTIVELLVGLVIISITFLGLLSVFLTTFNAIRSNEARVEATALANELMEEFAGSSWSSLALYADEALATEFEVVDGDPLSQESVVLLDAVPEASRNPDVPLAFEPDVPGRDGRSFEVERWVTWADDAVDQDLKRLIIILTWEVGERQQSMRMESLRSPLPTDLLDLEVSFDSLVGQTTGLTEIGLDSDFSNEDPVEAIVTVQEIEASVALNWRDRDGDLDFTITNTAPDGETVQRTFLVSNKKFRHGPVSFTVTATHTDDDGNQRVASNTKTITFYQDLVVSEPVVTPNGPDGEILVDCAGIPTTPIPVAVNIAGMTGAAGLTERAVTLTWNGFAGELEPVAVERTVDGGSFRFLIETDQLPAGSEVVFTADADRVSGTGEFDDQDFASTTPITIVLDPAESC